VFRCVARVFYFEVCLEDKENLIRFCDDVVSVRVSNGG